MQILTLIFYKENTENYEGSNLPDDFCSFYQDLICEQQK